MLSCSCTNGADCHPVTGGCVCAPGFTVSALLNYTNCNGRHGDVLLFLGKIFVKKKKLDQGLFIKVMKNN